MNDEVKRELVNWLQDIRHAAEAGKGFVLEQAPLVAREIVTLGRVESLVTIAIAILIVVLSQWFLRVSRRKWLVTKEDSGEEILWAIGFGLSALGILLGFIMSLSCVHWACVAWFAPRIYILHELAETLKTVTGN